MISLLNGDFRVVEYMLIEDRQTFANAFCFTVWLEWFLLRHLAFNLRKPVNNNRQIFLG